jgi:hypothetical protein
MTELRGQQNRTECAKEQKKTTHFDVLKDGRKKRENVVAIKVYY